MEDCRDFVEWLGHDLSMKILMSLDNPADIIRFGAVSTSWRHFTIINGISKKLCLEKFPELSHVANVIEENSAVKVKVHNCKEQETLEKDHKIYTYLLRGLATSKTNFSIISAISASSTGNYPKESIRSTLEPRSRVGMRDSYWSSIGQTDPTIPEYLVYKLISKFCIVTEIHLQPFEGTCFQTGSSIYSSRGVRFRMGYPKSPMKIDENWEYNYEDSHKYNDSAFVWTYTSPEFSMAQENRLQKFKLPEPVLCIGGILQVKLLGRVQTEETDGLFYIRVAHVQVVGRPLSLGFDAEIIDKSGRFGLNYYPEMKYRCSRSNGKIINRSSSFRKCYETVRNRKPLLLNSGFRGRVDINFLFIAFFCLFFLNKLSKVSFLHGM